MTPEQFDRYRELGLTRVPVAVKRLADMETPLSCYLKLADRPWSYLLESVTGVRLGDVILVLVFRHTNASK